MNAKDLGSVRMQPQKNDEGTMLYYQTDKGFGVHIDATSGKLVQVRHLATDATVSVDGVEAYAEPDTPPEVITVAEAVETKCLVEVTPAEFCEHPVSKTFRGVIVNRSVSYDGNGEPALDEFTLMMDGGGTVKFNEWTYDNIVKV